MSSRQKKKFIAGSIAVALLLSLPLFTHIYYLSIYFVTVSAVAAWLLGEAIFHHKLEKRFYLNLARRLHLNAVTGGSPGISGGDELPSVFDGSVSVCRVSSGKMLASFFEDNIMSRKR